MFVRQVVVGLLLLSAALSASAQEMAYSKPPVASAGDLEAIKQMTVDFRAALIRKDVASLSNLVLNETILFTSPPSPTSARAKREQGRPGYTGAKPGGFSGFAAYVASSPAHVEKGKVLQHQDRPGRAPCMGQLRLRVLGERQDRKLWSRSVATTQDRRRAVENHERCLVVTWRTEIGCRSRANFSPSLSGR